MDPVVLIQHLFPLDETRGIEQFYAHNVNVHVCNRRFCHHFQWQLYYSKSLHKPYLLLLPFHRLGIEVAIL